MAKVVLIDIETLPNIGYTWMGRYDQTVLGYVKEWELASVAWKDLGAKKVDCIARPDFKDDDSDASLTAAVWDVLDGADILIGHNIDRFDSPMLRAKFVEYGLNPTKPYKTIDTRKIARSQFRFNSNSLNDLASTLKLGSKVQTGGFDLWRKCMAGDAEAWARMVKYNRHDVVLLEKVYERLKAWYPSHPNLSLYGDERDRPACVVCASEKVQRRGYHVLKARRSARYQCQKCGHWFSAAMGRGL